MKLIDRKNFFFKLLLILLFTGVPLYLACAHLFFLSGFLRTTLFYFGKKQHNQSANSKTKV